MSDPPERRFARYYEELARRIEPTGLGEAARAPVYLDLFRREIIRDRRVFAFGVTVEMIDERTVALTGVAEYPEQAHSLVELLKALGIEARADVKPLPTAGLLDQCFAVATRDTLLKAEASEKAESVNQALTGEPVWLLDRSADGQWYWCHAADGYIGYVRVADVKLVSADEFDAVINARPPRTDDLDKVIAAAKSHMGKPYIWGGRSADGLDCSGLVQRAFEAVGVNLPRDAEQQAICGKLVATRWHRDALRSGDVLFFLGRRGFVAHTAIYLGGDRYIESADGGVKISSFNAPDPTRGRRRDDSFCFARRMID